MIIGYELSILSPRSLRVRHLEEVAALGLGPGHAVAAVAAVGVAVEEGDGARKDLGHRDLRRPEAGRYPVQQLLKDSENGV